MANRVAAVLALLLLAVAIAWPLLDIGPRGATLIEITPSHGVDVGDLLALVPLALAIALAWARSARAGPPPR